MSHDSMNVIYRLTEALLPVAEWIKQQQTLPSREDQDNLEALKQALSELYAADIADILESMPPEERSLLWHITNPDEDGDILLEVSEPVRESLIEEMDQQELAQVANHLEADDLVELSDDLPEAILHEAMSRLDDDEREQVEEALRYADDSVGSVMDFTEDNLITIRSDVRCEVVFRYLRRFGKNDKGSLPRQLDKVFIVDNEERLCGVLSLRQLLISDWEDSVMSKMTPLNETIYFQPDDKAIQAAQAFERYDLISAPVVDQDLRVIGRLTVDEMMDVLRKDSEEDLLNIVGAGDEDLFAPIAESLKKRGTWIFINLITAIGASRIIAGFEDIISQLVALAALLPIIAGIAGNSGNQTITMIVRAMGSGQLVNWLQIRHLLAKELTLALVNGLIWGLVIASIAYVFYSDLALAWVMLLALVINLILAALMAVGIPLLWRKIGLDPAMGSSVAITACTDMGGFAILLLLAKYLLIS